MHVAILSPQDKDFPRPDSHGYGQHGGLVAIGGDLSCERLLAAYSEGVFPWYGDNNPILWWSPDPRCVLLLENFHVSARTLRSIRAAQFTLSVNQAFEQVIHACASVPRAGQSGTWLLPEMQHAYCALHALGYAHSIEVWRAGDLVGGLYGLALGRAFFGESMFHTVSHASKAAVCELIRLLRQQNFRFLDCQQSTPHMLRFGAEELPRRDFLALLAEAVHTSTGIVF